MIKDKYKLAFMDMAERFAETSTAERLKVGALIVKNDSVIALGCNGMPPGWPTEVCEEEKRIPVLYPEKFRYELVTKPECRHAEVAALEKLWNSSETSVGAEMFVSYSPCKMCSIKIKTAGITKVYYRHNYRSDEGLQYLTDNGILVEQI